MLYLEKKFLYIVCAVSPNFNIVVAKSYKKLYRNTNRS